ncbi:PA domain-containing protein [Aeromicrobium sp.]|uniref:PA domain-containing protein n=1 Tax=Aeromicrobium sp. TaxID=1871063 RepID=UPI003C43253F
MNRTTFKAVVAGLSAAGLILVPGLASGHPGHDVTADGGVHADAKARNSHQHGETSGHLPASSTPNIDLVSKLKLKNVVPEKIADVGVLGDYAYLAAWGVVTCKYNGVHVVNIADVNNPKEVAFIGAKQGSYPGEGIQAIHIDTPKFDGDIVVSNNEKCNDKAGFGGMNIYDVTKPEHPTPLAAGFGDKTVNGQGKKDANEIHSVYAWDAGDEAYAVMVDNEEGKDVDIVDITDPKKPKLIAEYDLDETFPQILQAAPDNLKEVFLHDMVVKKIDGRQVMLLSYWDAGYVKVDMTDPLAPVYLGDTDFTNPDPEAAESGLTVPPEGNGHQAEFTKDNRYVVGSDEDFGPFALTAKDSNGRAIDASQGSDTKQLAEGETITGVPVFFGRGCNADATAGPGNGSQIAVVERGECAFTEKVSNVIKAGGYSAVLIFNRTGSDACEGSLGMSVAGDIPTFGVAPRSQGFALFGATYDETACVAGDGTQRAPIALGAKGGALTFTSYFDGWGYVHLFENSNGKMTELDTYAIPEAHDPAYASGFGDLSVHEVATSQTVAERLYFSYYAGGFRVAEIENDKIVEKGHYIAPDGNNFWGVQVFNKGGQEYVAASDRDNGLWIFKYTP